MKYLILVVFVTLGLSPAAMSQTVAEKFGTMAETWDAEISPDGKNLALGCSPQGVRAICIYALDSDARPRLIPPPGKARIYGLRWASNQYLLYYVNIFEGEGGQETAVRRLLSYDMKTGKTALMMSNARAVYDTTRIDSILVDNPKKVQMAFTFMMDDSPRTGSNLDQGGELRYIIYEVDLKSGKAKVKDALQRSVLDGVHDAKGRRYAEIMQDVKKKTFEVISVIDKRKSIYKQSDSNVIPFYTQGISADRKHLIVDIVSGDRFGLHTLSLVDGAIAPFEIAGEGITDVNLIDDPFTETILGYQYTDDLDRNIYTDEKFAKVAADAKNALKADSVELTSWTDDQNMFVVKATNTGRPENYYLYDYSAPSLSPLGGEAPWLDDAALGEISKVTYAARDGLEIPGYLTLPPGKTKEDGPFPLVLMPHGGPESRDTAAYDWLAQSVASQGYVVLQPNFRGSSGYGAEFRNAGYGEFGGKMVTDVLDGAAYLVAEGIAKPGGHCSFGWSYGGYSALMTGLHDAENTKCAISVNGVTDPFELMNAGPVTLAYWERYMGDLYRTSGKDKRAITPKDRASEYSIPLLLIHGKEDTTVSFDQSSQFARKTDLASLITMPGDDHYMQNTASRTKIIEESLAFLAANHPAK